MMNTLEIQRPYFAVAQLKAALARDWRGWHLSQKMDGVWSVRALADSILAGERMKDGKFYAFDVAFAYGADVRRRPWTERREAMRQIAREAGVQVVPEGQGPEFIETVLRNGGEGCVAKPLVAEFGAAWLKIKRRESYDCVVAEFHPHKQSIRLLSDTGLDRGWCPARGGRADSLNIGDVVEIACLRIHASGKFREPRLMRIRRDKMEVNL